MPAAKLPGTTTISRTAWAERTRPSIATAKSLTILNPATCAHRSARIACPSVTIQFPLTDYMHGTDTAPHVRAFRWQRGEEARTTSDHDAITATHDPRTHTPLRRELTILPRPLQRVRGHRKSQRQPTYTESAQRELPLLCVYERAQRVQMQGVVVWRRQKNGHEATRTLATQELLVCRRPWRQLHLSARARPACGGKDTTAWMPTD